MTKFITYNIWFSELHKIKRIKKVITEIKRYDADFIALQEVTNEVIPYLKQAFKTYFFIGEPLYFGYDTLLLSKYKPLQWEKYLLPKTKMGRSILYGEYEVNNKKVTVGTFHLESVFTTDDIKIEQFHFMTSILPPSTVLLGDTNISSNIQTHYQDLFIMASEPEFFKNTYSITKTNVKKYNSRLDKIFTNMTLSIQRFLLIGTKPTVLTDKGMIHPSDHYGVFVEVDI